MMGKKKKQKRDDEELQNEVDGAPGGDASLDELATVLEQKAALESKLLRAQADLQNLRRRQLDELQRARESVLQRILGELAPVVDALSFAEKSDTDGEELRQGFLMFKQLLEGVFASHGVRREHPEGEVFDPRIHEALAIEERDDVDAGICLTVHQDGLMLGDKVIRAARVVVSAKPAAPEIAEGAEADADSDAEPRADETDEEETETRKED